MTETLSEFGNKRSGDVAESINTALKEYISTPADLTDENLAAWAKGLVSAALQAAAPGIWQMATDTVAEVFINGDREGLSLTDEQAKEAARWILSWERVDGTDSDDAGE